MINEKRTLEEFGYTSDMLTHGSRKIVWRACEGCGKETKMSYQNYTNGYRICESCAAIGRNNLKRGQFNIKYFTAVQESINDGCINELKTFEEFGYYSIDLLPGSNEKVWRICEGCGKEDEVIYKNYTNRFKMCGSCAQKGKILSEEHKQRLSATLQNLAYDEWDGYITDHAYCPKFNEKIKEYIREKYGRRCFLCNKPEEENITSTGKMRKLSVHHVDMNKQQGCDGHKWKLVPLCMKCHNSKTTREMQQYIEYILENEA